MSKLKKVLLMGAAYVLVAALAIGGTIAYLTSNDSDVNVMTLGNVEIEQIEQQRVDDKDNQTALEDFENDKPLYPAVFEGSSIAWAPEDQWVVAGDQAWKVVEDNANVVDKFVTVKNTGKSAAYVRTLVAYEGNEEYGPNGAYIHVVTNGTNVTPQIPNNFVGYINIDGVDYTVFEYVYPEALAPGETTIPSLKQVYMNKAADNDVVAYYGETYDIIVVSQAVQAKGFANAKTALDTAFGNLATDPGLALCADWFSGALVPEFDTWDGTADTTWYNDTDTEFTITTAEQLAGLAELVDGGNTFAGKTITLSKNLDLHLLAEGNDEPATFNNIGDKNNSFNGVFDGQNHTILNLYQSGWGLGYDWDHYGSMGLFGYVNNATIKNITISGAECFVEGGNLGGITGRAIGDCTFENITIADSTFATYNNGVGGIVGWSELGNYTFKNITIAEDTSIGGMWGSFDAAVGGVVAEAEPGASYNFENVNIACRLDVYNDVTASYQWYSYRMCGMIIGRVKEVTQTGPSTYIPNPAANNVTCENVTVTYGDWANYTYCHFSNMGSRYVREQAGYSWDAYTHTSTWDPAVDAEGNTVTDSYHAHKEGEAHGELIVFDQLFGGPQSGSNGYYGLPEYNGVTVIYNNK